MAEMDVEIVAGLCPAANILVYFSTFDQQGWVDLLNAVIESLGKIRDTEAARAQARRELRILVQCLRETLRSRSGQAPTLATREFVERMSRLDDDDLLDRIEVLLDHERAIDLNANVPLAVEDALLRL